MYSDETSPAIRITCTILMVVTALATATALVAMFADQPTISKNLLFVIASTCFVTIALLGGALKTWYGRGILAGLFCCWLGDLLGPMDFYVGLYAFLFGHLFLIPAFCSHGLDGKRTLISAFIVLAAAGGLYFLYLGPHVDAGVKAPIVAYLLVISAMVISAGGTRFEEGWPFVLVAAAIFMVSDVFVARWKFVDKDHINALFCYPLYYTACTMLALSVHKQEK